MAWFTKLKANWKLVKQIAAEKTAERRVLKTLDELVRKLSKNKE